eukprot:m.175624 g.175624  ORF g.175624 m.175624 type:complete len:326 (+) comp15432_c1_seq9:302-1279(+)
MSNNRNKSGLSQQPNGSPINNEKRKQRQELITTTIAGAGAGFVTTILCSPLDVAKTRQQIAVTSGHADAARYRAGVGSALSTIWRTEGFPGFYRGIVPAIITVPAFWACYWPCYVLGKRKLAASDEFKNSPPWLQHMMAAVFAGGLSDVITNPLWVIRTRMQADVFRPSKGRKTMASVASNMVRQEGVRSLYKGLKATLLGLGHSGVQFPVYEKLKALALERRKAHEPNAQLTFIDLVAASSSSKVVASLCTYPHEVIRSRMQFQVTEVGDKMPGLLETTRTIIKESGFRGLYAGLRMNMLRVVPSCVSTFLVFEYLTKWAQQIS